MLIITPFVKTLESRTQASLLEVPVHKLKDRLSESLAKSLAEYAEYPVIRLIISILSGLPF